MKQILKQEHMKRRLQRKQSSPVNVNFASVCTVRLIRERSFIIGGGGVGKFWLAPDEKTSTPPPQVRKKIQPPPFKVKKKLNPPPTPISIGHFPVAFLWYFYCDSLYCSGEIAHCCRSYFADFRGWACRVCSFNPIFICIIWNSTPVST